MRKSFRAAAIAVIAVTSIFPFFRAGAQTPGPDYVATRFDLYTATADLWRTDGGFQSTIRLKNMLAVAAVDVSITLYMQDGTPYALPPVHLDRSAVTTISINKTLADAPLALSSHISQTGSATLQYRYDWAGAVLGSISILDTPRSLQYQSSFMFPDTHSMDSEIAMTDGPHVFRGMWWKYSTGSAVFLSTANATSQPVEADIAVFNRMHESFGKSHISLAPHASRLINLNELIEQSAAAMLGSLELSFSGNPGAIVFSGGIEDDAAGYSAALRIMTMPMEEKGKTAANTCTVAAAGLMLGKPDPMEGFPSSVRFRLFGLAHNAGSAPVTLQSFANYMDASGPHNVPLSDLQLRVGETIDLDLAKRIRLPIQDGAANLSFTFNAPCGSLLIETGSVDASGSYVFEVPTQAVNKSRGHTSHHWQAGFGTDTMYTVWNPTNKAEDLIAIINYEPGGEYRYPLRLEPNASAMLSILDLIRMGKPDEDGRLIAPTARIGSLEIRTPETDLRKGEIFVVSSGIYNPTAGTCCSGTWTCNGATSASVVISNFMVLVQNVQNETFYVADNTGSQTNYTGSANWSSSATDVMTAASSGHISGVAAGSATITSFAPQVPEYAPNFCGSSCPYGSYGAQTQGTTQTPTSLSVVSAKSAGCPGSKNYGIQATIVYQVLDQNKKPIVVSGMDPWEQGTFLSGGNYGPNELGQPTDTKGQFTDTPVGYCQNLPITATLSGQQNITIKWNGNSYAVRTNNWAETSPSGASGFGHGTITNGNDIKVTR